MTTTSVTLSGFVYDNAGNAVQDATVTAYTSADNATSANGLTDTTDANGRWDLTTTDETKYPMDVKVVFGSSTRWIKAANGINLTRLTVSGAAVFGEDATGVDVTMYGDTTGRYLLWDQSEDALHLNDSTELKIGSLAAGDMILYHDGTNSYITNATGALKLATESSGIAVTIGHGTSEVTIGDNLTVTGDLTVSGTTTTVTSTTVAITDSLLLLAKDQGTSADAVDFGLYGKYGAGGTAKYAGIFRDLSATNDPWTFFDGLENEPGTTVNTSGTNYALAAITAAEIVGTTIDASTDFTIGSTIITDGVVTDSSGLQLAANLDINGTSDISGTLTLGTVVNADADVDKFLVLDGSGNVDFRTGANLLSDIGATGATALDDVATGDAAATLATTVGDITIDAQATDADVFIKVDDNGTPVTAVQFDGSDEGNAIFVNDVQLKSDSALLEFGADLDTTLTHTDGTGLTLNSTNKLTFGDTDSYVQQSADGTLRIDGEAIIDLNASTRVDVSGDLKVGGEVQAGSIGYTDGDNSMTIADGGKVTFSAGFSVGSDAAGDILYHNGTSYVRLAKGSDDEVLTLTSGIPAWESSTVGDITSVVAGSGMTGGNTSGDATLNVIGGDGITANTNDVAITPAQTTITSIYATDLIIGEDSQTAIDFGTEDEIDFKINNTAELTLSATALYPIADAGLDLGTSALGYNDLHLGASGILNFDNANMTVTHSTGALTVAGGTFATAALTAIGALTVGVDDTGHDVKFFGASAGAYMLYDQSEDQLVVMGKSADATDSTGKLLLATSLTDVNANDVIGRIDFQAPDETGTDAVKVSASVEAVAQGTFAANVNATDLIFSTAHDNDAAERFRMTSQNELGVAGANYGTDGQVLTSGGAGAAVAWEDAGGGGGIEVAEQWRLHTALASNAQGSILIENWEIDDTAGYGQISAGMALSSGIFTFPDTGVWQIEVSASFGGTGGAGAVDIQTTLDNDAYETVSASGFSSAITNISYGVAHAVYLFDVTSTSNRKVKFTMGTYYSSGQMNGSSSTSYSTVVFVRLGDAS